MGVIIIRPDGSEERDVDEPVPVKDGRRERHPSWSRLPRVVPTPPPTPQRNWPGIVVPVVPPDRPKDKPRAQAGLVDDTREDLGCVF